MFLKKLLKKNEKGQGLMEYIIITALIGTVSIVAVKKFGQNMESKVEQMHKKINNHINIGG